MKRLSVLLLAVVLFLCSCSFSKDHQSDAVIFYYLQQEYQYGQSGSVLAPEQRELTEHPRNLTYWMALYLMGPVEEAHAMPLPEKTRIAGTLMENGSIQLELSEAARGMSDSEFSLACTCLSLTCFSITEASEVSIINGERKIVLNQNNLTLSDNLTVCLPTEDVK